MREREDECDTSKPKGIRLLLGLWRGQVADGERRSGILGGCGHSGGQRKQVGETKEPNRPGLKYKRGLSPIINFINYQLSCSIPSLPRV
jgi:hypothetical protein